MQKILFTFANWKYYKALDALKYTAETYGKVDKVYTFKESDIDSDFYYKNSKIFHEKRGFGFWIWKSYFINKLLNKASNDDIFIYMDSGNEVISDLQPLYDLCRRDKKGIILFENTDGEPYGNVWKNNMWTKSDCFNLMGLNKDEYIYGNQINASYIVFRKTDFSKKFFQCYMDVCQNYNIISDAKNITDDFNKDFKDHRHDQSILSLLSIRYKITIMREPSQWGNHKITLDSPYKQLLIHCRRKYYAE
jgi:hypothetical protein